MTQSPQNRIDAFELRCLRRILLVSSFHDRCCNSEIIDNRLNAIHLQLTPSPDDYNSFHKKSYVTNCLFRFLYWFYIACIHTVLCVYVCYMLLINTLTLTWLDFGHLARAEPFTDNARILPSHTGRRRTGIAHLGSQGQFGCKLLNLTCYHLTLASLQPDDELKETAISQERGLHLITMIMVGHQNKKYHTHTLHCILWHVSGASRPLSFVWNITLALRRSNSKLEKDGDWSYRRLPFQI